MTWRCSTDASSACVSAWALQSHAPRSVVMPGYLARVAQVSPSRLDIASVAPLVPRALHQFLEVLLCACALSKYELRERCDLTLTSVQAVRVRFPELLHPPGFGAHRLTVFRRFDVAPARAWSVLSDWRAPYISASGTGACRSRQHV